MMQMITQGPVTLNSRVFLDKITGVGVNMQIFNVMSVIWYF